MNAALPYALIVALVVIVAALAGVVLVRRSPARGRPAGASPALAAAPMRDETLIFRPQRRAGASSAARLPAGAGAFAMPDDAAYLVPLLDEAGTPGEPIAIRTKSAYIGRDPQRAQVVFSDPTVSRLHARLVLESDGVFTLHDEGSTSGTFVNDEQVDLQPRRLRSGDVIDFGRQRAIFQVEDAGLDVFAGLDADE